MGFFFLFRKANNDFRSVCLLSDLGHLSHFGLKASQGRFEKISKDLLHCSFSLLIKMQFVLQIPEHFGFAVARMRSFSLPI